MLKLLFLHVLSLFFFFFFFLENLTEIFNQYNRESVICHTYLLVSHNIRMVVASQTDGYGATSAGSSGFRKKSMMCPGHISRREMLVESGNVASLTRTICIHSCARVIIHMRVSCMYRKLFVILRT